MFKYGKTAQNAISAMSYLAEVYDMAIHRVSSLEIARQRGISKPLVAKLLVVLSQAGLVQSSPGPRGGYFLAKDPDSITLLEIVGLFERLDSGLMCPLGPNWCGNKEPCPLHDKLLSLDSQMSEFLKGTTLAAFARKD